LSLKIGIIGKPQSPQASKIAEELMDWLSERGVEVYIDQLIGIRPDHRNTVPHEDVSSLSDIILALGGDGTFLTAARLAGEFDVPILGINLGRLGFLTEINLDEIYPMMERLIKGDYVTEERDMLSARIVSGKTLIRDFVALNEVVINKSALARIIDMDVEVDGVSVTTFQADGLIISTPTGSTAYSLSAGGPIVYPTLPVTVITPICPHTLINRPLVLPSDSMIKVRILPRDSTKDIYFTVDGQEGIPIDTNDTIEIKKGEHTVKLIKSPFIDYFKILKIKLGWGEIYAQNT